MLNNELFGIVLTISLYIIGIKVQEYTKIKALSPMLTASVFIILFLIIFKIPYSNYRIGGNLLSFFVAPATVVLTVPLYKNINTIKKYFVPIMLGNLFGIIFSALLTILLCKIFGINRELLVSLIPKSITSAVGYEISKRAGGISEITVLFIIIAGLVGYSFGETILKLLKIKNKISIGLTLGANSHILGAVKSMEMGEIESSISTVSITITAILSVIIIPLLISLI